YEFSVESRVALASPVEAEYGQMLAVTAMQHPRVHTSFNDDVGWTLVAQLLSLQMERHGVGVGEYSGTGPVTASLLRSGVGSPLTGCFIRLYALSVLFLATAGPTLASSWFGADEKKPWTQEQLDKAQKVYGEYKDEAFDSWTESRLRQFLLDQGVIEPKGTREQLAQMARNHASASASTAIYGDSYYQATQSASSAATKATEYVKDSLDDTRDYIYSTWDDNQLRTYLESKGIIRTHAQVTRDEMLAKMREAYASASDPVYAAWSDSYIRRWLIDHNIVSEPPSTRDKLLATMNKYYYDSKDYVWSSWTDSDLHDWLVQHNVIKSEAQVKRDKMLKMVQDNYLSATNTFWDAWTESELRAWLIEHGYMRTDAQVKRDELVALANSKYTHAANRSAEYLTWPDARLRAYLRMHGLPESQLPTTRPGLLHEVRIRYVIAQTKIDNLLQSIKDAVYGSVETAEEKLNNVLHMLTGAKESAKGEAEAKKRQAYSAADKAAKDAQVKAEELKAEAKKLKSEL
ncbi:17511_t:CDS:2, partial [Acaulospora colombiana]